MKTKTLILSLGLALLVLLTISVVNIGATDRSGSAIKTPKETDGCPMHEQVEASQDSTAGTANSEDILRLIEVCEKEVGSILSSTDLDDRTEKLIQFRKRLAYTKQSLLQPKSYGGCCGDTIPTIISSRDATVDAHSGCGTESKPTNSTE